MLLAKIDGKVGPRQSGRMSVRHLDSPRPISLAFSRNPNVKSPSTRFAVDRRLRRPGWQRAGKPLVRNVVPGGRGHRSRATGSGMSHRHHQWKSHDDGQIPAGRQTGIKDSTATGARVTRGNFDSATTGRAGSTRGTAAPVSSTGGTSQLTGVSRSRRRAGKPTRLGKPKSSRANGCHL